MKVKFTGNFLYNVDMKNMPLQLVEQHLILLLQAEIGKIPCVLDVEVSIVEIDDEDTKEIGRAFHQA